MEPAEKLSITLPAALARLIRRKVETGAYASNSEVIREALRVWQDRERVREERLAEIREELVEAVNDPRPGLPANEVFEELRNRPASRRKRA